jgi:hypothetical protein
MPANICEANGPQGKPQEQRVIHFALRRIDEDQVGFPLSRE